MRQNKIIFCILMISTLLLSCRSDNKTQTEVTLTIKGAAGKKVFLIREPLINEVAIKIDSVVVIDLNHPIRFIINDTIERLYKLRVEQSNNGYYFITDVKALTIDANEVNGKYDISLSPASISLKSFNENQSLIAADLRKYAKQMKNLTKNQKMQQDSMRKIYDTRFATFQNNYINYADTVKSGAAFMTAYANIEFGQDYYNLKSFVDKAVIRFPNYKPIIDLKSETYEMIDIFEQEYKVGDTLPIIKLYSSLGSIFSTESLKGKYYLIDFWATWCPQCLRYNYYKKQLWKDYQFKQFSMLSVALDDEKNAWLKTINEDSLVWLQLIDEKMWRGTAAKTLKFDSIPYNFLVDPNGIILQKAIKQDSLLSVVSRYVK